ncbi:programmed cell death 1 ligand 1 isoform X2 [Ambystoma mexicanum]|uniref:programmed cell death 1 ligand 1 isoform X2 n=1 Tax=Ambystoma mexicanum TaxID=8296 RepID=UPI0037E97042
MENTFLVFISMLNWHYLQALFSVKVPQSTYTVQIGNTVDLECTFPVNDTVRTKELMIIWQRVESPENDPKEVYVFHKGVEDFSNQHSSYKGRTILFKDELLAGRVVLQITDVRISDRGTYNCLIGYQGADYKHISLVVEAPYRKIIKTITSIQKNFGHKGWEIACHSEGYPLAEVVWHSDGEDITEKAITNYTVGSDQLHNVTSVLQINEGRTGIFHCTFWNRELQQNATETFIIADVTHPMLWPERRGYYGAILAIIIMLLLLIAVWWSQSHGETSDFSTFWDP